MDWTKNYMVIEQRGWSNGKPWVSGQIVHVKAWNRYKKRIGVLKHMLGRK